jgi:hypothetical protein
MPATTIAIVDAQPKDPAGLVGEADLDVDPVRTDLEPGRVDRCLQPVAELTSDLGDCRVQGQACR